MGPSISPTGEICHELVREVRRELTTRKHALARDLLMVCKTNIADLRQELGTETGQKVAGVMEVISGQLDDPRHEINEARRARTGLEVQLDGLTRGEAPHTASIASGEAHITFHERTRPSATNDDFPITDDNDPRERMAALERRLTEVNITDQGDRQPPPTPGRYRYSTTQSLVNTPGRQTRQEASPSSSDLDDDGRERMSPTQADCAIPFHQRTKGPRHVGAQTIRPADPVFDRLMN